MTATWVGRATIVALVVSSLLLAGCRSATPDEPPDGPAASPVNATSAPLLPLTVDELPTFDFAKFEDLGRQLHGTPVVVNIWSSWCGPCRSEAPHLAAAARQHGQEIQFLGVDILDDRGDATLFIRQYEWNYPSIFNPSGDIRDHLGFIGQPETLFYGTDGNVVSTWIGPLPADELERRIAALLE